MIIDNSYCQEQYFGPRSKDRRGQPVDMIVMHTTESSSFQSTANTFMQQKDPPVTAHYVVDRNGQIYRFCPEGTAANHAGKASWQLVTGEEVRNINQRSIGIEFQCGPGEEITPQQAAAGLWLTKDIMSRNPNITPDNVVGHSDVAPSRKADPGMSFPWELWVQNGLASNGNRRGNDGRSSQMSQEMLLAYQRGYFNVNNYNFTDNQNNFQQTITQADVQNHLAQQKSQTTGNMQDQSLSGNIFEILLSAYLGININTSTTLASAANKSITDDQSTKDIDFLPLSNINNILG